MKSEDRMASIFYAMRELLLAADSESLATALDEAGIDPADFARAGRAAANRALAAAKRKASADDVGTLHEGLSVLLQLLCRRDGVSHEQLAQQARIEAEEINRIETDLTYMPNPRTIYQLEQFFRLPKRSLVKLTGMTQDHSQRFTEEVMRFAASSKTMHKLTRSEEQLLNAFVRFLGTDAAQKE